MIVFTQAARNRLDEYLNVVRRAHPDVSTSDIDEVIADIRDHVEEELANAPAPISAQQLAEVLERLGDPRQWADKQDAAPRSAIDWAMSTAALVMSAAGLLWQLPLILVGYILARVRLERGKVIGPERWLVYPPLTVGVIAILLVLLFWPYGFAVAVGAPGGFLESFPDALSKLPPQGTPAYWLRVYAYASIALGVWWALLGVSLRRAQRALALLLPEKAASTTAAHGNRLALVGGALALLASVFVLIT
jgi:hypothetical protein